MIISDVSKEELMNAVRDVCTSERKAHGYTVRDVARLSGLSVPCAARICRGSKYEMLSSAIFMLADAFGMSAANFVNKIEHAIYVARSADAA